MDVSLEHSLTVAVRKSTVEKMMMTTMMTRPVLTLNLGVEIGNYLLPTMFVIEFDIKTKQ